MSLQLVWANTHTHTHTHYVLLGWLGVVMGPDLDCSEPDPDCNEFCRLDLKVSITKK